MRRRVKLEFERNRLGRLVCNVEKAKHLPLTTRTDITMMFPRLTRQIQYLKERLEQLGGPMLVKAQFELDDSPRWTGYHDGSTWNGFATPRFDKAEADRIISWLNSVKGEDESASVYDPVRGGYIIGWDFDNYMESVNDPDYNIEDILITPDKDGLYSFDGWTWFEVEEEVTHGNTK